MPTLVEALKTEITRLARKEVRAQTSVLKKAVTQYRSDIAQLKRTVAAQERRIAFLERAEQKRLDRPRDADDLDSNVRFSIRSVKSQRKRLGLSAADFGTLAGVTGQTVLNWENGRSRPQDNQMAALVELRSLGKREALRRLELLG